MDEYSLEISNISKTFPGVKALNDVSFNVKLGEIHAVVGENGSGKSTLMKILSGVHPYGSYEGSFRLFGKEARFSGIRESENAGIAMIYQELALVKQMDVAENIFLGEEMANRYGKIDRFKTINRAKYYLKEVGLNINPMTPVLYLGVGQRQLVEIAKALSREAKILILDEPTSSLTEEETENLFNILRSLKNKGTTCIFITHRLKEVFACSDRVTIIRDGNVVSTNEIGDITEDIMVTRMVGREIKDRFPKISTEKGEVVMEVKNWTVRDPNLPKRKFVDNVSFTVRKGEILGIAGLMGAGRTELVTSLFGCYPGYTSGEIFIEGKKVRIRNPIEAIKNGISYVSEDRVKYGLYLKMNIQDNVTISSLEKISKFGFIDKIKKILKTNKIINDMKIKTPSSEQIIGNLSGGNQQKVILGKWLLTEPKVLILDEPTRGIDVGVKFEVYNIINKLVEEGVCIIMISSELPEVLGMGDRIIVINKGKISAILSSNEASQEKVMQYATKYSQYE